MQRVVSVYLRKRLYITTGNVKNMNEAVEHSSKGILASVITGLYIFAME
jgi:hypothetical protein